MNNIVGKTFIFLGSSVTYGSAADGVSFADHIVNNNKCVGIKEAVSGTTLVDNDSSSYIQRMINNIDKSINCDLFICQLSTNDATQNLPMGNIVSSYNMESFDKKTIIGAIEYIISYVKETWKCPVVFYTGTYYDSPNYQKMVDALYELKDKWGIGIIDLWNDKSMKEIDNMDYEKYMADPIHPTEIGYREWWTPVFEEYLNQFDYKK